MNQPPPPNGFSSHGTSVTRAMAKRPRPLPAQEALKRPSPEKKSRQGDVLGLGISDSMEGRDHELVDGLIRFHAANLTPEQLLENVHKVAAAEKTRSEMTEGALAAYGIIPNPGLLLQGAGEESIPKQKLRRVKKLRLDFLASLSSSPELFMEIARHLSPTSLLKLYCISKDFHETVNSNLSHILKACAAYQAPESSKIFVFKFYAPLCITDPTGRPHPTLPGEVRLVPSLRWLQMVCHREKCVRDILACMAREGHRMPKDMSNSLKKMWLVMDIATSSGRTHMCHGKWISDKDLWNWQFFIVKLDMRFNDPIDGPGDDGLRKLFLGQKGLTQLWKLLRRKDYLDTLSVTKLMVRYRYRQRPQHKHLPLFGIPPEEIGIEHLEGWGKGRVHLLRPDELVIYESVRRAMGLKHHIMEMMLWGYVDPITSLDTRPADEEKYISDDEEKPVDPYWCDYVERDSDDEYVEDPDAVDTGTNSYQGKSKDKAKEEPEGTAMYEGKGKGKGKAKQEPEATMMGNA